MHHHTASINGITLHYVTASAQANANQQLLLFVHGFPQYWGAWRHQLAEFGADYFAVALDMRGFNLSDKPEKTADYRIEPLMADLQLLITHLGYDRCILVAHDWGGAVAWSFAARFPGWVEKLVIINAPHAIPFAQALAHDPVQQAASQYMLRLREPDAANLLLSDDCARLIAMFKHPITQKQALSPDEMAAHRAAWLQAGAMDASLNYYRASPLMPPKPDQPGAGALKLDPKNFMVEVPTLVIWAMQDRALPPLLLEGLDALVRDLTILRVADGSHWVVHEQPDVINTAIRNFLEKPPKQP